MMSKWILPSTESFPKNYESTGDKEGAMYTRGLDAEYDLKQALDLLQSCLSDLSHADSLSIEITEFLTRFKPTQDDTTPTATN